MKLTTILLLAILATGCAKEKQSTTTGETSGDDTPLVLLCREIDYSDSARLRSEPYMKKTIGKIVRLMSATDSATSHKALSIFFGGIRHDEKSMREATRLADLYLNNPGSPVRDETLYIRLLQSLLAVDSLPEEVRTRGEENLRKASLNRPGCAATDFNYLDRKGREGSLYKFSAPQTILIFYDPECPHCPEILRDVASHRGINRAISEGNLRVLAIYAEGKRDVWDKTKADMPGNWTVGYDLTGILDNDLYDLPAMPIIYLLDGDKRVILKDPDVRTLLKQFL